MKVMGYKALMALGLIGTSAAAFACADSSCYPRWKLFGGGRGCEDRGFLAPGNDTRTNLNFLIADKPHKLPLGDRYPKPSYGTAGYGSVFLDPYVQRAAYFGGRNTKDGDGPTTEAASSSQYEGTRCGSYERGSAGLDAAMQANGALPLAERNAIAAARASAEVVCAGNGGDETRPARIKLWPVMASKPGQEFLRYAQASDAFYADDFPAARDGFAALAKAGDPWVRETAAYMLIRTEYAASQSAAIGEYGDFEAAKVDLSAVKRGLAANGAYLNAWPTGRYSASAQGLVRRGLWLAGDYAGLAKQYEYLIETADLGHAAGGDLAFEIDNKWLFNPLAEGAKPQAPTMLAVQDLYAMRTELDEGGDIWREPTLTAAQLEAQKPVFAAQPELFSFLEATHALYIGKNPRRVLSLVPDDAKKPSYSNLAFSRQVLRGQALAALKDRNEEGFWLELLGGAKGLWQRPTAELGLAMSWERSGKLAAVFAQGSPIQESMIRRELIIHSASPAMLRTAASDSTRGQYERDLAAFVLLLKGLSRGDYKAFAEDRKLVRPGANTDGYMYFLPDQEGIPVGLFTKGKWADGYNCPALDQTARTLAANPNAVGARLCLGDFWRLNGFDDLGGLDGLNKPDELGGVAGLFPGKPSPRSAIYASVIADPRAAGPDKAYALYRAVMCYAPAKTNTCGGKDVAQGQRKAWYDQLKRDYPSSQWAKKLRYFW
ncbi:MAG: hypothetical protein ABL914_08955 [Novosphingobium sp.]|uniref:hypothetical protein n=1 Tax=Novosphingobium sp. TaxID=1874826 RepID=UPI0032BBBF5C